MLWNSGSLDYSELAKVPPETVEAEYFGRSDRKMQDSPQFIGKRWKTLMIIVAAIIKIW